VVSGRPPKRFTTALISMVRCRRPCPLLRAARNATESGDAGGEGQGDCRVGCGWSLSQPVLLPPSRNRPACDLRVPWMPPLAAGQLLIAAADVRPAPSAAAGAAPTELKPFDQIVHASRVSLDTFKWVASLVSLRRWLWPDTLTWLVGVKLHRPHPQCLSLRGLHGSAAQTVAAFPPSPCFPQQQCWDPDCLSTVSHASPSTARSKLCAPPAPLAARRSAPATLASTETAPPSR
jgi:hypothetical protein